MSIELGGIAPFYLLLLAILAAGFVARRVPFVRAAVSLITWFALAVILFIAVEQRQRFDPYLDKVARLLKLEDQRVVGDELRIRMAPDGHFWARVRFGGIERRMLVDSGATLTALSSDTAAAAGLTVRDGPFPVLLRTANGIIRARTSRIDELWLGNIVARDLPVVVSPALGSTDVIGMNFLSRLKSWRVEGKTLVLVPHHPQNVTGT